ncbi:MAG: GMP synthase subunit A [Halobacteriales archaeon]|nr:GMP synthase subunit A [Halobacteriales archaeon]
MIAVIDNGGQFTHLEGRALRDLGVENRVVESDTPVDEVLPEADGVVLSGGPSIEGAGNSAEYLERDVPVLGICLGHQIIAEYFGGEVGAGEYGGYADVEVEILDDTGVLAGLGDKVSTWASHADEVKEVPDGFVRTARSDVCEVEAMRHESRPIYGVQWHPEVSHTEKGDVIFENFVEIAEATATKKAD